FTPPARRLPQAGREIFAGLFVTSGVFVVGFWRERDGPRTSHQRQSQTRREAGTESRRASQPAALCGTTLPWREVAWLPKGGERCVPGRVQPWSWWPGLSLQAGPVQRRTKRIVKRH